MSLNLRSNFLVSSLGNQQVILRDKFLPDRAPVVVYCPGAGGSAWGSAGDPATAAGQNQAIRALASAGYLVIATDTGVPSHFSWSNDSAYSAITDAIAVAQADPYRGKLGPVILMGTSMGGGSALAYAAMNPGKVAAVIGLMPMVSLAQAQVAFPDSVNDAYSGGYSDAVNGNNHSPLVQAPLNSFADRPIHIWHGDSDAVARPVDIAAFKAAVLAAADPQIETTQTSGGHTEAMLSSIPSADIVAFARTHLTI